MEYLRLLFISGLLFEIAIAGIQKKENCWSVRSEYRLPVKVTECRHYNIKLIKSTENYDKFSEEHYRIEIRYFIEIYKFTENIHLHYDLQSEIDTDVTNMVSPSSSGVYHPARYLYCHETQILEIQFATEIFPGNYTLDMVIKGTVTTAAVPGFSKIIYFDEYNRLERTLFATNFHWNARVMFPCWDEPHLKATFNISVKHSQNYTVLSNMPIRKQTKKGDLMWTHFKTTPLMSTYYVGIIMFDNFAVLSNKYRTINIWGRKEIIKHLRQAHDVIIMCRHFISNVTNFTEQIPKMDYIAIPLSTFPTKLSWGLYNYKESEVVYNPNASLFQKKNLSTYSIPQSVAYHWYGTIVTPTWWNYKWLTDGIAKFLGLYITNKIYANLRAVDRFVVENQQPTLSEDILSRVSPLTREIVTPEEIGMLFSPFVQSKATALIRMMNHYFISDKHFQKAIRIFLHEKLVNLNDFWHALSKVIKESKLAFEDWNFPSLMANWFSTSNYPVLYVRSFTNSVAITQHCFHTEEEHKASWWIPISYTTESNPNFDASLTFWLRPEVTHEHIPVNVNNSWIIFNLQQIGYYRVNYDTINWRKLINYLKSGNYTKIHPINRAQLIDDSYHLMLAGNLHPNIFLNITGYLRQERDYVPWYPMKRILSNMSIFFRFPESTSIKEYMAIPLNIVEDIGLEENIHDTDNEELLKLLLLDLACKLGHLRCLEVATVRFDTFLQNPHYSTITPSWEKWIFCMGMTNTDNMKWQGILTMYRDTKELKYLEYMTCVEDPLIITNYMRKLILNYIRIEYPEHRSRIIHNILKKHSSKDIVLDYVLTNYYAIRNFARFTIIHIIIKNVYYEHQFEKLKEFALRYFFEEQLYHENFKSNLIYSIARQSNKIQAEVNMFVDRFRIRRNETSSVQIKK